MATVKKISPETMKKLPKAELHRHLDGSVRPITIIELAKEQGVKLPTFEEKDLTKLVSVDETCTSLEQYLLGFSITCSVLQKHYALVRAMYEVCEDAWRDGVRYLEVRFAPILHTNEGMSKGEVMEAVCEGRVMAMYRYPIKIQIIVCAMRQLPASESYNIAEIAWRYRHKGVAAFDLAGPEHGFSSKLHKTAFELIRNKCIHCTIHSGEAAGWVSIQDSIRYCGANRIGHGVRLIDNLALMEYVISHEIALECCPTSNLHTKAIESIASHPIRKFFDAGVITVPCTDNTTVSNVTLTNEYLLLQDKFGFTVEEIVRLLDYGFRSAFITSTEKRRLRADCLHDTLRILAEDGHDLSDILKNDVYYRSIGANLSETGIPIAPPEGFRHARKAISLEVLKALPKTDLHCRLDGSVSIDLLWKELNDAKIDLMKIAGREFATAQELADFISGAETDTLANATYIAKAITRCVLQTPGQLERAVDNVLSTAASDGVKYMELVVRPLCHTEGKLTPEQVLDVITDRCKTNMATLAIKVGIVVYANTVTDDPIVFRKLAEVAVAYHDKYGSPVVGFGCYGDDAIPQKSFKYFLSTFEYLKSNNMNVSMVAGLKGVGSILQAIHEGGASRISGAYHVHTFPRLMNFLATQGIPVELSLTPKLRAHTQNATFAGSPFRLLIDNDIPITICSFRGLFTPSNRVTMLENIVQDCKLSLDELLKLLCNGFQHNFSHSSESRKMQEEFWRTAKQVLSDNGCDNLFSINFNADS
eukprot:TRINITY_DN17187_c0_g1_i1.p1 TRINITY_DN17187_c0_g1~~TRINITY_DN17187_c0_g1_i1.p1  ORF type:complete len:761 (-),score=213.98 TRINITY_DN17187_c0_g1_i1:118-2400(-)